MSEGLETGSDIKVREFAAQNEFSIVTRDRDFADLDALFGPPPKAIWLNRENAPTSTFEQLLRSSHEQIEAFFSDPERSLLIIG
jgi:predicted nuclease of predicted toxin-antitoxin system